MYIALKLTKIYKKRRFKPLRLLHLKRYAVLVNFLIIDVKPRVSFIKFDIYENHKQKLHLQ